MEDHQDLSSSGSAWIDDELMHKERAWWHKLAQKLISSGQVMTFLKFSNHAHNLEISLFPSTPVKIHYISHV